MRNIQHYAGDPLALFDAIIAAKTSQQATLQQLRGRIDRRYRAYDHHKTNLVGLLPEPGFTKAEREALIACYDSATAPLKQMKRAVIAALPRESNKCPYCGLGEIGHGQGEGGEGGWDHYLPRRNKADAKQAYAEFSVHPQNLIPCCAICNSHKGERWREGSQRHFVHVYHDAIDHRTPFLEARVEMDAHGEPKVTFNYADMAYSEPFGLFRRHCEALDLKRRFATASLPELAHIRDVVQQFGSGMTIEEVVVYLQGMADSEARRVGVNHWKATLYRAVSRSREFVAYCKRNVDALAGDVEMTQMGGQGS